MVLVLKNDQMENLLPMSEEIDAIEQAFRELGQGKAMNAPRARLRTPWKEEGGQYYFNNIMGLVPGVKSMALRIDSSFSKDVEVDGSKRRVYPGDYHRPGHALRHGHLRDLGDHGRSLHLDDARRRDQRRGEQIPGAQRRQGHGDSSAPANRPRHKSRPSLSCGQLTKVKVYSPTKANREKFARQMSARNRQSRSCPWHLPRKLCAGAISSPLRPTRSIRSSKAVARSRHARHSFVGGDGYLPRKELDDEAIRRANLIIVGYKPQIFLDKQAEFHERLARGLIKAEDLHELGDLLNGKCRGRQDDKEITFFKNNTGMGIQFAATARKMYEKAKEKGIGAELPLDLFMTKRGDKLYSP